MLFSFCLVFLMFELIVFVGIIVFFVYVYRVCIGFWVFWYFFVMFLILLIWFDLFLRWKEMFFYILIMYCNCVLIIYILFGWCLIILEEIFFMVLNFGLCNLRFLFRVFICWSCLVIIFGLYEIGFCDEILLLRFVNYVIKFFMLLW